MAHLMQVTGVAARVTACDQDMIKSPISGCYWNKVFPMLVTGFVVSCASEGQNFKQVMAYWFIFVQ